MSDHDQHVLAQQLDGSANTFASIYEAIDHATQYDDGSGSLQDPHRALSEAVMEVRPLRAIRLLAEDTIEADGEISDPRLVAISMSDRLERPVSRSSGVGRALQRAADGYWS